MLLDIILITRKLLSSEPVANYRPSGENATNLTKLSCKKVAEVWPDEITITVAKNLVPKARYRPSCENAMDSTYYLLL